MDCGVKRKIRVIIMNEIEWILCPLCGGKTRNRIRGDTVLINYPLYGPKCRRESLIKAKNYLPNNHHYRARCKDTEPMIL